MQESPLLSLLLGVFVRCSARLGPRSGKSRATRQDRSRTRGDERSGTVGVSRISVSASTGVRPRGCPPRLRPCAWNARRGPCRPLASHGRARNSSAPACRLAGSLRQGHRSDTPTRTSHRSPATAAAPAPSALVADRPHRAGPVRTARAGPDPPVPGGDERHRHEPCRLQRAGGFGDGHREDLSQYGLDLELGQ